MTDLHTSTGIAIIGCGYVFDHYMTTARAHPELSICGVYDINAARADVVGKYYGLRVYGDFAELLEDVNVKLVVNLTSIESHYDTTRALLLSGKHVYCEKPLTKELDRTRELLALAGERGLTLASAPCNLFSDTVQTMWKAVRDGAIGRPLLVYAEFDDNPIYLMKPEGWRSRTGAPWPFLHEYEQGCTVEHVGYHLVWICAIFGPAESVTAFSSVVVPHKTDRPMTPADTPDFSVACIRFSSGVVARITCSIAAPADHRMRIVGDEGEISSDTYRHYQSPVLLERFSALSLNARKARTARVQPLIGRLFGIGGRRVALVHHAKSHATLRGSLVARRSLIRSVVDWIKGREVGAQDKMLGVALSAQALREGAPCPLPSDFVLHVNELTLAIQNSGPKGMSIELTTRFEPLEPLPTTRADTRNLKLDWQSSFLERRLESTINRLHKH